MWMRRKRAMRYSSMKQTFRFEALFLLLSAQRRPFARFLLRLSQF
jgi:hypothetical protein